MFSNVSWGTYLIFLAITAVIYYSYVGVTYYKKELARLFNRQASSSVGQRTFDSLLAPQSNDVGHDDEFFEEELNTDDDSLSAQLKRMLEPFIERSAYAQSPKTELMFGIHIELAKEKYAAMVGTPEQSIINAWIIDACERYCSIQLGEDELQTLWIR